MPDLKTVVSLTNSTVEKMSRHDMLDWVNSTVNGQYKKIEELCSGVAYCQMMELLFPNTIGLKKLKCNAKLEHEFLHNLKLFQAAFTKLNFDKSVPIDRLIKGKFQDNFEFLQWFKKFFDTYSPGKENLKLPEALTAAAKPIRKPGAQTLGTGGGLVKLASSKSDVSKTPKHDKQNNEKSASPSSVRVLEETVQKLTEQMLSTELERNTYYKKLTEIETILNDSVKNEVHVQWCSRALAIMYNADDNGSACDEEISEFATGPGVETSGL